jgi:hypothetical protein
MLLCADLHHPATLDAIQPIVSRGQPRIVYSDPPWNPGNEKYWRTHAGANPGPGYDRFLAAWCDVVTRCIDAGTTDVFCEQSSNQHHRQLLLRAVDAAGWPISLRGQWTVCYGHPKRPNTLLHFGRQPLATNPSGLSGEAMTACALSGVAAPAGSLIVDPCMGKGMTSRMAVRFGWNFVGVELNQRRMDIAVAWLARHGYAIQEVASDLSRP